MKLFLEIDADDDGVRCTARMDAPGMKQADANLYAIGAIEVAKASLLAARWGVNIGNFKPDPIVKPPAKAAKRKKA
jgi:hypothetical protein